MQPRHEDLGRTRREKSGPVSFANYLAAKKKGKAPVSGAVSRSFFHGHRKNEGTQMKHTISLKENHEFRRLYHRGTSTAGRHLVLYCRKNRLGYNRLGLTVSAKLAGAVQRNRVKRLFREAYRLHEDEFATGVDLVLVARSRAVGATYWEIEKSLLRALKENKIAAAQP